MIFAYNKAHVGDCLMVICANDKNMEQTVERKGNVAQIKTVDGTIVGYNFFEVSTYLPLTAQGQVKLTQEQVNVLNEELQKSGFAERLTYDASPKFMVGFVKECVPHPDSDHLSITQIDFDGKHESLQIVCGAPNIRKNLKSRGSSTRRDDARWNDDLAWRITWRKSFGMICSARELQLPNAPMKRGILELGPDAVVGSEFVLA